MNFLINIIKTPSRKFQDEITILANHLLFVLAFFAPIYNRATSSIVFTLIILLIIRRNYKYYFEEALSNKIVQATLLFIFINILWLIGSDNFRSAISELKDIKYYLYPLLFLLFIDKRFINRIITGFILGMLFSELISYLIHFNFLPHKLELSNILVYEAQGINNPSPFLNHSMYNVLLSIAVGIMLYNLLKNVNKFFVRIVSIFFIVTASINLVLVGGRIGYLAYIFIIPIVLFLVYRNKIFKMILPIALLLVSLFFYFSYHNSSQFKLRINNVISDKEKLLSVDQDKFNSSIGLRLGFWLYSIDVLKEDLFFGVGTGDHMDAVRLKLNKEYDYIGKIIEHPHNEYLKNLLQFGIVGFLVFLNIFYQIFKLKIDAEEIKSYLIIVTIGIGFLLLTDIFVKNILIIFLLFISVCSSKSDYLKNYILELNIKVVTFYIFLIFLFLIIIFLEKIY